MKTKNAWLLASLTLGLGACGVLGGGNDGKTDLGGSSADMAQGAVEPKFSSLYNDYLSNCKDCHAPTAPGRGADTEKTMDFSSAAKAYQTLTTGKASNLMGNFMSCNGVAFVVPGKPEESLLLAAVDGTARAAFKSGSCSKDTISDMTLKVGQQPTGAFLAALKSWISAGALNN